MIRYVTGRELTAGSTLLLPHSGLTLPAQPVEVIALDGSSGTIRSGRIRYLHFGNIERQVFVSDHIYALIEPVKVVPMPDFNPRHYTIEEKFGVQPGEDWLAVYQAAPFHIGQRVCFNNGYTRQTGVVLDIRRCDRHTRDYEFQVQYDGKPVPRWTLRQWLYE